MNGYETDTNGGLASVWFYLILGALAVLAGLFLS